MLNAPKERFPRIGVYSELVECVYLLPEATTKIHQNFHGSSHCSYQQYRFLRYLSKPAVFTRALHE